MGHQVLGTCETTAHAVKFTFFDQDFTADGRWSGSLPTPLPMGTTKHAVHVVLS